jgi:hypothetical protein
LHSATAGPAVPIEGIGYCRGPVETRARAKSRLYSNEPCRLIGWLSEESLESPP